MVGLLGACAPIVVLDRRRVANRRVRRAAWPDALRDLATRLRSGASMHAALTELGRLGPAPLRPSFARYETLAAALDHRVALETIGNELADPLTDRIVEVLLVAFDQGSRVVVDVLEELAASTVRDLALTTDIETAQLETKLEARSAAVLPFVVLGLLCLGSEGYRNFYASGRGTLVIVFGFVMSLVGVVLVDRLGRIEVEPRILRAGGGQR
ncbi:MAG: type II secretion system F family protein [Acidimicrobiales bacterium]